MTREELEDLNGNLIALLKSIRNQIDETLETLIDDEDESDDLGEFDDDDPDED